LKSLHKALDLIEAISKESKIGVRELAAKTGYPPATVHRIIATLTERGYLQRDPNDREYALSTRFLGFADSVQQQFNVVAVVRPHLERLSAATGENANLCVRDGNDVVYIDHIHSQTHILQTFTRLGARAPLYATGVGKAYLSRMSRVELDNYLKEVGLSPFTDRTITDRDRLEAELAHIRESGYAVDDEEKETGVRCIAAPVFDQNGVIVAAISVSGAVQWISTDRIQSLADTVIRQAERISADLGYRHH
jgi:IclR family acetate operon transcriptional repressor